MFQHKLKITLVLFTFNNPKEQPSVQPVVYNNTFKSIIKLMDPEKKPDSKFTETQKINQLWLWITLIIAGSAVIGVFGFGFYQQIILGQQFGNNPMSDLGLIVVASMALILILSIILLFTFAKLTTEIDKNGVRYKFFPFHFKFRHLDWSTIEKYQVVKYNPLREYGGWGIRIARNKKAYTSSGDKGLLLYLKNGKQLLIGTQKYNEMIVFLKNEGAFLNIG